MSEVISFRLDKNCCREAQALKILQSWQGEGYRTRDIMIQALLQLEETYTIVDVIKTLEIKMHALGNVLDQINLAQPDKSQEREYQGELSDAFLSSLRKNI